MAILSKTMCSETPHSIERPLLTIAIPTYNRAQYLNELLSVLADQLKNERRVELIVSDNASSDQTPSLLDEFVSRGLQVRYLRNTENIGPDANFLQCFEQANGKYVWIFSDDDLVIPGALSKILRYCQAIEYDLIWVSGYSFKKFHKLQTAGMRDDTVEISDPREYVKRIHVFFTFISGNIINKDRVLASRPPAFSSLIGTNLLQLGWTYTALNGFVRGLYIREKLIAVRDNNQGGYKLLQVFGPTLVTITKNWLKSPTLGRIVTNGTLQRFWPPWLLRHKKWQNHFISEEPKKVLTPAFKDNIRYWAFAYPVIVLPRLLAEGWVFAIRVLNRLDKAAGFFMIGR